jgi:predicted 2-oxoglutarate/Fe(II)-dependent dioxygenase YbiX
MLVCPDYAGTHKNPTIRRRLDQVQSMVRDETRRAILFDFDNALQHLGRTAADHDACVRLAGIYHNLLRQWADS